MTLKKPPPPPPPRYHVASEPMEVVRGIAAAAPQYGGRGADFGNGADCWLVKLS